MNENSQLQLLWELDMPPAQDLAFLFATLRRIERRGFILNMVLLVCQWLVIGWACWQLMPAITLSLQSSIHALDGVTAPILASLLALIMAIEFTNSTSTH